MGYDIFYDRIGVTLPKSNTYLLLSKIGCSNVYDAYGKGNKRSRSWSAWFMGIGCKPFKKDDAIKVLEGLKQSAIEKNNERLLDYPDWDKYDDKNFGWFEALAKYGKTCRTTSYRDVYNFHINALDNPVTIEQLRSVGIILDVSTKYYSLPSNANQELKDGFTPECVTIKDEDHLMETLKEFSAKYDINKISWWVGCNIQDDDTSKNILSRIFPNLLTKGRRQRKPKQLKELEFCYTLNFDGYGFFKKKTRRATFYTYAPYHIFETEKQAQAKLSKMRDSRGVSVVRHDRPVRFYA